MYVTHKLNADYWSLIYPIAADFNFSTDSLAISEKGDLSQMLFINKTGENTETIEFQVIVTPGTATPINGMLYCITMQSHNMQTQWMAIL